MNLKDVFYGYFNKYETSFSSVENPKIQYLSFFLQHGQGWLQRH